MQQQIENGEGEPSESVCAGCLNILDDEEFISALGQEWHMECFRCSACDASLSNWYFEKDGLLFCKDDYWSRYGEACQQCSQIITGPVMVAGEHKFHPECFCCSSCSAFIGDGDSYALVERSKLYCGQCYKRQMQPLQKTTRFPFARKPHSIRLVEIPGGQKGIKLSADPMGTSVNHLTISEFIWRLRGKMLRLALTFLTSAFNLCCYLIPSYRLDVNNDLMSLHIGDRILEINGSPVKDTSIENVENLLRYSDTVLQLTIEHDPHAISRCRPTFPLPQATVPLTTTSSDTNIPVSNKATDGKIFGSTDAVSCEHGSSENLLSVPNRELIDNNKGNNNKGGTAQRPGDKERLFKRRDEGYMSGTRSRQLRRKNNLETRQSLDKERSSSMSRLLDDTPNSKRCMELSRAYSFLEPRPPQRVFRASDLVKGELLGQGFFGQVFKVTTRDTAEVMVLKELYRVDEEAQKNFLKEVAVLRSLHHNNVLRFIGVLYKERRLHLVTEYIAGGTLTELIHDTSQPLPWEQRVSFAKDIAAGMAYLHSMNIIHRDLNSHNCLVREDKTVIVADFGLARIVSQATNSARRVSPKGPVGAGKRQERKKRYTVVGNPYWMAPEMMKGNKYDEKVDIFSFGIVLCEIIGRVQADPDFLPRSNDFGLNQNAFREKFCVSCPEPFYKIVFLCTDLNPDKRPPFEVMEVWLESLSMHLSVNMPLPSDLLFDIQHYQGLSPSSSGSTTPEGISSGHRSPALEPIREGKQSTTSKTADNLKPIIKVSSADNLINRKDNQLKPIIKVSSSENCYTKPENLYYNEFSTKSCEEFSYNHKNSAKSKENQNIPLTHHIIQSGGDETDVPKLPNQFDLTTIESKDKYSPTYENLDFLRNDSDFSCEKQISIKKLDQCSNPNVLQPKSVQNPTKNLDEVKSCNVTENNLKCNVNTVPLRKVPKNFTRNRFSKEKFDFSELKYQKPADPVQETSVKDRIKFLGKKNTFEVNKPTKTEEYKRSNLSLQNMGLRSTLPSKVTQKFVNSPTKAVNKFASNIKEVNTKPQNVDVKPSDQLIKCRPSSNCSIKSPDFDARSSNGIKSQSFNVGPLNFGAISPKVEYQAALSSNSNFSMTQSSDSGAKLGDLANFRVGLSKSSNYGIEPYNSALESPVFEIKSYVDKSQSKLDGVETRVFDFKQRNVEVKFPHTEQNTAESENLSSTPQNFKLGNYRCGESEKNIQLEVPDVVSSTFNSLNPSSSANVCKTKEDYRVKTDSTNKVIQPTSTFSISKNIFKQDESKTNDVDGPAVITVQKQISPSETRSSILRRKYQKPDVDALKYPLVFARRTPVLQKRFHNLDGASSIDVQKLEKQSDANANGNKQTPCDIPSISKTSACGTNIVKNIIESLNRKDRGRFDFTSRGSFGRSSLKVMGNPKVDVTSNFRSCSPEEFTAL